MVPAAAPASSVRADWARAFAIAVEHHLVAYRLSTYRYAVPSHSHPGTDHIVTFNSDVLTDSSCDCQAYVRGYRGGRCSHRAVAMFSRKHGIHAVRAPEPPVIVEAARVAAAADAPFCLWCSARFPLSPSGFCSNCGQ